MKRISSGFGRHVLPVGFMLGLIVLWEVATRLLSIPMYVLPGPAAIIKAGIAERSALFSHSLTTIWEAVVGCAAAMAVAFPIAIAMDAAPVVRRALYPVLVVSQNVPVLVLAPVFMIFLGFGMLPKVATVVLMCFFPIVVSLADGMRETPQAMVDMLKGMGAGPVQIYRRVRLPFAASQFFSGVKVAATYSVMGAVVGEWLGGEGGLGLYMLKAKNGYMLDRMFAAVAAVVLLSLIMNGAVALIKRLTAPWTAN